LHKNIREVVEEKRKEIEKIILMNELKFQNIISKFSNEMHQLEDFRKFLNEYDQKIDNNKNFLLQKISDSENYFKQNQENFIQETKELSLNIDKKVNDFLNKSEVNQRLAFDQIKSQ